VWDTALALNALAFCGADTTSLPAAKAARWLVDREVRTPGDWAKIVKGVEPSGWFFEYRNAFYPDMDDTSMVLMGLARSRFGFDPQGAITAPARRGLAWLLAMQSADGGWAAFDRDINRDILTKVPFADHNAMLDPSCPDITGRVIEALGLFGTRVDHPAVSRALTFLRKTQDRRGCWIGRWGVNYLYGTWQVLQGLEAIGFDRRDSMVRRAVAWLESVQQPSGAWGESCASYDDPRTAGQGDATASQTAWGLLGLIAAGEVESHAVRRGVDYLIANQDANGGWSEKAFTGTGFPKVFYLKYHLYPLYFPMMALARVHAAQRAASTPPGREFLSPARNSRGLAS
jgi:squalene-hopene/tetraprenyl-beta-curcumene cyclase